MGLATRRRAEWFPQAVATYGGDVLWASMMYWLIAILRPHDRVARVAVLALSVAFMVEASQLLQIEPLLSFRDTTLGALVLGHGFVASDLIAYAVGVAIAALIDAAGLHRYNPSVSS